MVDYNNNDNSDISNTIVIQTLLLSQRFVNSSKLHFGKYIILSLYRRAVEPIIHGLLKLLRSNIQIHHKRYFASFDTFV